MRDARGQRPPEPVGRSATTVFASRLVAAGANWIGTVLIARELSTGEFGAFSFIFGLLGIIGLVVDLQVGRVVIRDITDAGQDAGHVTGSYVVLRTVIGVVAYVLAMVVVVAGGYDQDVVLGTAVAGFGFLAVAPANGIAIWFTTRLWMRPEAVSNLINAVVPLALVVAFLAADELSVVLAAAALTIGEIAVFVWRVVATRLYHLHIQLNFDRSRWWQWLKESLPLALGFSLVTIYYKLDIILLSQLDTLDSVAQYAIGYKFADLAGYLPYALLTPVMTLMVVAWPDDAPTLHRHFRRAWTILFVAGAAIAVGFALVAGPVIELLYGDRYAAATDAARFLVMGACIQFFSYLCFTTLASIGRNVAYACAASLGFVVNLGLNLWLIPEHSFDGAAVATVVTELVVLAALLLALRRTPGVMGIPGSAMLRTVVAALALAVTYLAVEVVAPWPVAAAAAAAAFFLVLHIVRIEGPGGLPALWQAARFDVDDTPVQPERPTDR